MTTSYIFKTNDAGRERLALQHQFYVQSSLDVLSKANIKEGMKGLEVGCGSGDMTKELLKLVGPSGSLLSIDLSKDQVDNVAQEFNDHENFRCIEFDVNELTQLDEKFDFIYIRMVLHHLSHADVAIEQMKACLNPGGIVVCEEPSIDDSIYCSKPSDAFDTFMAYVRECFTKNKRDFKIGYRLEHAFADQGFKVIHHSLFQPVLRTPEKKRNFPLVLMELAPQLIQLNIATPDEIDTLHTELTQLSKEDNSMTGIRMHQVIAVLD